MAEAISNTSPLVYLFRIDRIDLLRSVYSSVWIPSAVVEELNEGLRRGHSVPNPAHDLEGFEVRDAKHPPSRWLALDLGPGELAAMALALDHPERELVLDDALARRTAKAAGLRLRGTVGVLLAAKSQGFIHSVAPEIERLVEAGLWLSPNLRTRILALAGEAERLL